jgi:hypothetical protein
VLGGEATHINFAVFGGTRPGLEPAIYRYRGGHTNHYITDAFEPEVNMIFHFNKISYYENDHQ